MQFFTDLKILARSRSLQFTQARKPRRNTEHERICTFKWRGFPVSYRSGTSDAGLIYEILIRNPKKAEYRINPAVQPKVVLDIGANIGVTALWLHNQFPDAKIYCFEPVTENIKLLKKNTASIENITVLPFALGDKAAYVPIYANIDDQNKGGYSIHQRKTDPMNLGNMVEPNAVIDVRVASDVLREMGVTQVDLIKIDTEGNEYSILSSIPEETLSSCAWIMGELHGIQTFETLALLNKFFRLGLKKTCDSEVFTFEGLNIKLLRDGKYRLTDGKYLKERC